MSHATGLVKPAGFARALTALGVVLLQAAVFVPFSLFRFVDGDEGLYLIASKLALDGKLLYGDFLYTQMPLLPYVYGAWAELVGESWYAARLLSVAFAVGVGVLLYHHLTSRFGRALAFSGLVLYTFSGLVFAWFTTVKTQALSTLLLFAAYAVVARGGHASPARWAAAGALAALAIDTRLIFAAAVPALAWGAFRSRAGRERLRSLGALAGGMVAGLLPAFVYLALDPDRFLFDNLGYHGRRSSGGLVGDLRQKGEVAANLLGIGTPEAPLPQFLLLVCAAGGAAVALRLLRGRVPLALWIAAFLGAGSFLPTPTYTQYFAVLVPFLIVGTLELVAYLRALPAPASDRRLGRALAAGVAAPVAAYVGLSAVDLYRYVERHADIRIGPIERVGAIVQRTARPGEQVLTSWPGYLFGTDAVPVSGMENDFAPHEAAALSADDARRYRLASARDVERMIVRRRIRLVVFRIWIIPPITDWEGALRRGGYRLLATVESTRIYVAPPG